MQDNGQVNEEPQGIPIPQELLALIGEKELIIRQQSQVIAAQNARLAELEAAERLGDHESTPRNRAERRASR